MVRRLLALLVASAVSCGPSWNDPRFVSVRDGINQNPASTWKAAIHTRVPYDDEEALRRLCGTKMDAALLRQESDKQAAGSPDPQAAADQDPRRLQALPFNFDLRQAYPSCWSIGYIRDQANCGSCWAISSMSSLSDRYCINNLKRGDPTQKSFSYQDPLECCSGSTCGTGPNKGCNGGYIHGGFAFAQNNGVVSGENYQNYTTCKPYSFRPGATGSNAVAPSCNPSCTNNAVYANSYSQDRFKISKYATISAPLVALVVLQAMQAIISKGSIIAGFDVYMDLYYYSSGVYQRSPTAAYVGGHAVRVIGWGMTPLGIPYWIVANSWGPQWGIQGFFWIIRGVNNCRFESFMTYGEI